MKASPPRLDMELGPLGLVTVETIYGRADQHLLQTIAEDRRVERKPASVHADFLGEYFSMWANTPGGGLIVVGLADDGGVLGCLTAGPQTLIRLEQAGRDYAPDARYTTRGFRRFVLTAALMFCCSSTCGTGRTRWSGPCAARRSFATGTRNGS